MARALLTYDDADEKDKPFQIAILLYPGVTALDAVGPWEVFSRLPHAELRFAGKDIGPVKAEALPRSDPDGKMKRY